MTTSTSNGVSLELHQSQANIFATAVKYILTEWPSLNFAIENGMGGQEAKQKREWMCEHIIEVMVSGKDIDLEDYLAEIVNQEFDTLIEDGSLEYNAQWINKFYKDCNQGKEQDVLNSINQAASKRQSLGSMRIPPPQKINQDSDDDDDDDGDDASDESCDDS